MIVGTSIWTTECSYSQIDTVCRTYPVYPWLSILGLQVVGAWAIGILWLETRPLAKLRAYWKVHVSSRPRTAIVLTTLSSGLLGILVRWINGWPPFYPENFFENYAPWLFGGAVAGFLFALLMNRDSLRKAGIRRLR